MSFYYGFGLKIQAPLHFPELPQGSDETAAPCDVRISLGKIEQDRPSPGDSGRGLWVRGNQACYSLRDVGVFLVTAGRHILVEPHDGVAQEALRLCILGPVLALALQQRGLFTLHASAVSIGGGAVAFLGGHGWGKSTMAALLQACGHPVISDDLTAIDPKGYRVIPGFPQVKLWPDAAVALGHASNDLPRVHPGIEKRALRFSQEYPDRTLPLRRLYLLAKGETLAIDRLTPLQSFEEITRHWYGARFGEVLFESLGLRSHFRQVAGLAKAAPVRRLQRPATLRDATRVRESIENVILRDLECGSVVQQKNE
jgi:hypothetical protein